MEAARAAVHKITSRKGHTTDVDEYVNPAVTSETVKPHRHEETQEAIDREVHQDHYHTTVQPIAHKEVLPEKHTHNIIPQVHREFKHDNESETKERVARELGQFQHSSTTHQTTHSADAAPAVTGEHVHHHVHETVQVCSFPWSTTLHLLTRCSQSYTRKLFSRKLCTQLCQSTKLIMLVLNTTACRHCQ